MALLFSKILVSSNQWIPYWSGNGFSAAKTWLQQQNIHGKLDRSWFKIGQSQMFEYHHLSVDGYLIVS